MFNRAGEPQSRAAATCAAWLWDAARRSSRREKKRFAFPDHAPWPVLFVFLLITTVIAIHPTSIRINQASTCWYLDTFSIKRKSLIRPQAAAAAACIPQLSSAGDTASRKALRLWREIRKRVGVHSIFYYDNKYITTALFLGCSVMISIGWMLWTRVVLGEALAPWNVDVSARVEAVQLGGASLRETAVPGACTHGDYSLD